MELLPIDEKKSRAAAEEVLEQYREKRAIVRMPAMPKLTSSWGDGTANSTAPRSHMLNSCWKTVNVLEASAHGLRPVLITCHANCTNACCWQIC